jgi:hypothetical protein
MDVHYPEQFRDHNIGFHLVQLGNNVRKGGVQLSIAGNVLFGPQLARLKENAFIVMESDVRKFLDSVAALGGWDTNEHFLAIQKFLPTHTTEEVVAPKAPRGEEPPDSKKATVVEPLPQRGGVDLLERVEVEVVDPVPAPALVRETAPKATSAAREKVGPPLEHPDAPGWKLQPDGFYWKDE